MRSATTLRTIRLLNVTLSTAECRCCSSTFGRVLCWFDDHFSAQLSQLSLKLDQFSVQFSRRPTATVAAFAARRIVNRPWWQAGQNVQLPDGWITKPWVPLVHAVSRLAPTAQVALPWMPGVQWGIW